MTHSPTEALRALTGSTPETINQETAAAQQTALAALMAGEMTAYLRWTRED